MCRNKKCGKSFVRERKTYKYCCPSCSSSAAHTARAEAGTPYPTLDPLSPFRYTYHNIVSRSNNGQAAVNISLEDLKLQWEKQHGICPYTGWAMILPRCSVGFREPDEPTSRGNTTPRSVKNASLDRIDSSIPYTTNNIEWVSVIANYAKRTFTRAQVIEFCKAVATFNS